VGARVECLLTVEEVETAKAAVSTATLGPTYFFLRAAEQLADTSLTSRAEVLVVKIVDGLGVLEDTVAFKS